MSWVGFVLVAGTLFAVISLFDMLLYRNGHKTTIEADLLFKQMRLTGRLRVLVDLQKDRIQNIEEHSIKLAELWEAERHETLEKFSHDIGELPEPPLMNIDLVRLVSDVEAEF